MPVCSSAVFESLLTLFVYLSRGLSVEEQPPTTDNGSADVQYDNQPQQVPGAQDSAKLTIQEEICISKNSAGDSPDQAAPQAPAYSDHEQARQAASTCKTS